MIKIIALVLLLVLSASMTICANEDAGLEEAIVRVKSIIEIPEDMSDFDYEIRTADDVTMWHLYWNSETAMLDADIDSNGDLRSYYFRNFDDEKGELISVADAIKIAKTFLQKVMGDNYNSMRLVDEEKIPLNSYGQRFEISFERYENDVPVHNQACEISINKFSGMVENYYFNSGFNREDKYEAVENLTEPEKAISSFVKEGEMRLCFYTYFDYDGKTTKVFPAYCLDGTQYVIDAQNGEKIVFDPEKELYKYEMANASAANDVLAGGGVLSPEEQKKVEEQKELLTESELTEILVNKVEEFKGKTCAGSAVHKSLNDEYTVTLEFEKDDKYFGDAVLNAKTGEIYSFYFSTETLEEKDCPDEKEVTEFVRLIAKEKAEKTVLETENNYYNFKRTENGVQVSGDGIRLHCDKEKGYIYSYNVSWAEIDEFPSIADIKSPEEILAIISGGSRRNLMYLDGNLVYSFMDSGIYSPYTGEALNYKGEAVKKEVVPSYNDISGHWCEKIIISLLENGFAIEGDSFKPDEVLTQKDFVGFINKRSGYYSDEEFEDLAENYFDEVDLDAPVTRNQAAKAFAKELGWEEIAMKTDIFKAPFADCEQDEYLGYIALCKAFGIVAGDGNNSFRGKENITRAETASMIYNQMCR